MQVAMPLAAVTRQEKQAEERIGVLARCSLTLIDAHDVLEGS